MTIKSGIVNKVNLFLFMFLVDVDPKSQYFRYRITNFVAIPELKQALTLRWDFEDVA